MKIIDYVVSYIVHNTRYTAYQTYRVLELIQKYGDKAPYHMTGKQKKICNIIVDLMKRPED